VVPVNFIARRKKYTPVACPHNYSFKRTLGSFHWASGGQRTSSRSATKCSAVFRCGLHIFQRLNIQYTEQTPSNISKTESLQTPNASNDENINRFVFRSICKPTSCAHRHSGRTHWLNIFSADTSSPAEPRISVSVFNTRASYLGFLVVLDYWIENIVHIYYVYCKKTFILY
jgi:hypothetical protein